MFSGPKYLMNRHKINFCLNATQGIFFTWYLFKTFFSDTFRPNHLRNDTQTEFLGYNKNHFLMPKIQLTIVPRQVGQLWDQLLDQVLNDVCSPSKEIPVVPLPDLIPHNYNPRYNLYQGQCYQQHTSNLCGYHATFNNLCFLNFIKRGDSDYNILSGASFWKFKRRIQSLLFKIKKQHKLQDEWPWRQSDILYGDFERTYNKVCLQRFQDFSIFRNHQGFQLYSFTWQFQYQNLLLSDQKRRQLNKLITYFKKYNNPIKPLVISFMLGITNHWMCLNAVKVGNQTQYWFFDSFNRNVLDLEDKEIQELVEQLAQERIRFKEKPFSQFFKKNIGVCFKDTQISLKLLVDCLEGKTTIDQYLYNQQFNVFANHLQQHWDTDHVLLLTTIKQYWYNITSFLRRPIQHGLFTPHNALRFKKLVQVIQVIKVGSSEGKSLYQMIKYYQIRTRI